jgi:hypothetical protein
MTCFDRNCSVGPYFFHIAYKVTNFRCCWEYHDVQVFLRKKKYQNPWLPAELYFNVKAVPLQSLGRPWGFQKGWGSQISRRSAHEGGRIVSPTHRPVKQSHYSPWTGPEGPSSLRLPDFKTNRHMKVVRLSALRTGRLYPHRKYSWYSFMLGYAVAQLVEGKKSEGRGSDSRWCHWNCSLT